jgi:tetratricopeptide (TPR) repeat protein
VPEDRSPRKPRSGGRPGQAGGRPSGGRPGQSSARSGGRTDDRRGAPSGGGRDKTKGFDKEGARRDGPKRDFSRPRSSERSDEARTESQARYDGPPLPEEITGKELDRSVQAQLQSLPDKLAQRVARHLVAAGLLIDSDPKTAYEHTLAARARASRLAVVREAVGEAAYAAGEYTEALAELRAAKRMNGVHDYVAMMADCERALGRPDRALALVRNAPREKLSHALLAELTIVEAGARRDRGELDAALRTLETSHINSKSREPWVARLRYAYADTLVEAGRPTDALAWFHRTEAVDGEGITDAADRAAELEKSLDAGT